MTMLPLDRQEPLDLTFLSELEDATGEVPAGFVRSLIEDFTVEIATQLTRLEQEDRSDDFTALKRTAHRLKGCAATMGARPLAALSAELEDAVGPTAPACDRAVLIAAIATEVARVDAACRREVERLGARP